MTAAERDDAVLDDAAPPIEVRDLYSAYGDHVIHEHLNLTVRRGDVLGVVGGSGAGKSVLLNTIIGLKRPEGGSVRIFGADIQHARHRAVDRDRAALGRALPAGRALVEPDGEGERRRAADRAHRHAAPRRSASSPT